MEQGSNGKVVIVVIVVIQPVLELTPVQVIRARPTGSQVSVTVCKQRKKRDRNTWGHDSEFDDGASLLSSGPPFPMFAAYGGAQDWEGTPS